MRAWIVIASAAVVAGCGGDGDQPTFPDLVAVSGVVLRDGKPAAGGSVRFTPDPDRPEFLINSEVGPDGRFALATVRTTDTSGERKPGVPPGTYLVTYTPMVADQTTTGWAEPIELPESVVISEKEVDLKLILPAPKKAK
jgi:hypothetical protein